MEVVKVDLVHLEDVISLIKKGKVIVCPTDTVYGLICDGTNEKAVRRLFRVKKRPKGKPISIFVKDIKMVKRFAHIDKEQEKFLKKVWPGALTAVLRPKANLPSALSQEKDTIGVRIPNHRFLLVLIDKLNLPLGESSANISGRSDSTKIKEVLKQFEKEKIKPDLVLDEGNLKKAKPSTVVDLTGKEPKILRQGEIKISREMFS